jgi:hypothetical protein
MIRNYILPELKGDGIFGPVKSYPTTLVNLDIINNDRAIVYHNIAGGKSNTLSRPDPQTRLFKMARLYDNKLMTIAELTNLRMLGTAGELITTPENLRNYVREQLRGIIERHQRTKEGTRWDALLDGSITFTFASGITATLDFGYDGDQTRTVSVSWATASTDIGADLDIMKTWFATELGNLDITAYCGRNIQGYLRKNTSFQHGQGSVIRDQINTKGRVDIFYDIKWIDYWTKYVNLSDSLVPYIPDDVIVFIANVPGSFENMAGPAEAEGLAAVMPGFQITTEGAGAVSYTDLIKDPPAIKAIVEDNYLPVIRQTKAVYVLDTTP